MLPHYRPPGGSRLGFEVGFDIRREIHGEQAYEFERPVYVGDVLDGTTTLTDAFEHERSRGGMMTIAILETGYRGSSGELVVTERSTIIETESAIDDKEINNIADTIDPRIEGGLVSQTTTGYD